MQRTGRRRPLSIVFKDCRTWSISATGWSMCAPRRCSKRPGRNGFLWCKTGISPQQLQELFIQYGTVFQNLRVNMIFTIPVWLAYSPEANRLPFERHMIHDTPVYDRKHGSHESGRAAGQAVLEARVSPAPFAQGQMTRLIAASGGNLRDLFALVLDAGEGSRTRNPAATLIGPDDAKVAINKMRREYRMKLGQSPYDAHPIPYSEKLVRLLAVYGGTPDSDIPDPVLYSLLRGRAIQEFRSEEHT